MILIFLENSREYHLPNARAMYRPRSISGLICLALIFICATRSFAQDNSQNVDTDRQRAEALWEEAIRAKGGRERLHSIESLVISSTIDLYLITPAFGSKAKSGHVDQQTERLYVMPGKAWLYEFTPSFDVSLEATVINIERSLCMVTLAPSMRSVPGLSVCVPTIWSKRLVQDPVIYLMETRWVRPKPIRTRTEGKGKKQQDVIEMEANELRFDFYLDRKTHLPVKLVTQEERDPRMPRRMNLMITFEDYVEVDGIQMPRRVIREPLLTKVVRRRDTERARYRFNVTYDEKIFNQPVSKNAKFNDWELKN